jgi:hypothetical protein
MLKDYFLNFYAISKCCGQYPVSNFFNKRNHSISEVKNRIFMSTESFNLTSMNLTCCSKSKK